MKVFLIALSLLLLALVYSVSTQASDGGSSTTKTSDEENELQANRTRDSTRLYVDTYINMGFTVVDLVNRILFDLTRMGGICGCPNLVNNDTLPRLFPFHLGFPPPLPPPQQGQGQGQGPGQGQAQGQGQTGGGPQQGPQPTGGPAFSGPN